MKIYIYKIHTILAIAISVAFIPFTGYGATLHAILAADTSDDDIGNSVYRDIQNMKKEVKIITKYTGMNLSLDTITGSRLKQSSIVSSVNRVKAGYNDVILFYFSGHGFGAKKKNTTYPFMVMSNKKEAVDEYWVFKKLCGRKPRLLIVISDSCNNFADFSGYILKTSRSRNGYRKLFLKTKGAIIASSSRPGEYSVGNMNGGLYTNQFLSALHKTSSQSNPTWQGLMQAASKKISYQGGSQRPQYSISSCSSSTLNSTGDGENYSNNTHYPSELNKLYAQLLLSYLHFLWGSY